LSSLITHGCHPSFSVMVIRRYRPSTGAAKFSLACGEVVPVSQTAG
jgi:hypothetical protein